MTLFQCLRDAVCCRNLLLNLANQYQVGLCLLPQETKLFLAADISPMWAAGTKGYRRPRPNPVTYQLNLNVCPYLTHNNRCSIYNRRPLVCRAHPLSIHPDGTVDVDAHCPGCQQQKIIGITAKLPEIFNAETINANLICHNYLAKAFSSPFDKVFLFDLKTRSWKQIARQDVDEVKPKKGQ